MGVWGGVFILLIGFCCLTILIRQGIEPCLQCILTGDPVSVPPLLLFFFKFIYLIYLFLAALGLRCCVRAFSSCGERELLFFAVRGLLIAVASLVEHRL